MTQSHFSLSWDAHQKNICNGLSSLQQNGELVDMTIAADGHMVKVHQVIIALASPYIKELIASAQCPHPVVFLNNISYTTLCSILEYIYTGEAMVSIQDLNKLAEAGRQLHIKGLEEMKINQVTTNLGRPRLDSAATKMEQVQEELDHSVDEEIYFEITSPRHDNTAVYHDATELSSMTQSDSLHDGGVGGEGGVVGVELCFDDAMTEDEGEEILSTTTTSTTEQTKPESSPADENTNQQEIPICSAMQYTVSTQGSLQMILNRFIYYLKHTNRRDGTRQWRCVDYLTPSRCPAYVVTKEDTVLQRVSAHSHYFHDKKILKKVQTGSIFSAIQEAVFEGQQKKHTTKSIASISTSVEGGGGNDK